MGTKYSELYKCNVELIDLHQDALQIALNLIDYLESKVFDKESKKEILSARHFLAIKFEKIETLFKKREMLSPINGKIH